MTFGEGTVPPGDRIGPHSLGMGPEASSRDRSAFDRMCSSSVRSDRGSGGGSPRVAARFRADGQVDLRIAGSGAPTHDFGSGFGVHSDLDQLLLRNALAEVVAASTGSMGVVAHAQLLASDGLVNGDSVLQ